jgi:hypothetical protein
MKKIILFGILITLFISAIPASACDCDPRSPGYWKNHDEWPVDCITIGTTSYTSDQAIELMEMPIKGNKWLTLFKAYCAGSLNQASGCSSYELDCLLQKAGKWLDDNECNEVRANSKAWQGSKTCSHGGEWLYMKLECFYE